MGKAVKSEPLDAVLDTKVKPQAVVAEGGGGEEEEDDDDEVVREMDVFVSPALSSQLCLMQFPLHHQQVSVTNAARIKPKHGMIELENKIPDNIGSEGNHYLSKRTYGSHTIPIATHMAMGKVDPKDGSLHLVPLSFITQMRPTFSHIDEADPRGDDDRKDDATTTSPKNSKSQEKKPLMFQKKESERAAMARKSSYAYKRADEDSEEWIELSVHDNQSVEYQQAMMQVACNNRLASLASSSSSNAATTAGGANQESFVHSLNYMPPGQRKDMTNNNNSNFHNPLEVMMDDGGDGNGDDDDDDEHKEGGSSSKTDAKRILLIQTCQRVTVMLQQTGLPVPYSVIRPQFPPQTDNVDLLRALGSCAVLVRGNFVLQSRLMGPSLDSTLQQARTFILLLLQSMGYVQRSVLLELWNSNDNNNNKMDYDYKEDDDETVVIGAEWITLLLSRVARPTKNGWVLHVEDNHEFCEEFPEQTQLHNQYWERQANHFADWLLRYREIAERIHQASSHCKVEIP